ncbi:MAG: CheY-like chemotaxis protein [Planctomycetota bacterium]
MSGPPTTSKENQRVLVVDDNDIVRKTLTMILQRLGYVVTGAASGEAALEIISAQDTRFDCMVIDRVMPGLSGPQLIHNIRSTDADVPIVLTSGFGDADDLPEGSISGLLSKPWTTDDVSAAMRGALGQTAQ